MSSSDEDYIHLISKRTVLWNMPISRLVNKIEPNIDRNKTVSKYKEAYSENVSTDEDDPSQRVKIHNEEESAEEEMTSLSDTDSDKVIYTTEQKSKDVIKKEPKYRTTQKSDYRSEKSENESQSKQDYVGKSKNNNTSWNSDKQKREEIGTLEDFSDSSLSTPDNKTIEDKEDEDVTSDEYVSDKEIYKKKEEDKKDNSDNSNTHIMFLQKHCSQAQSETYEQNSDNSLKKQQSSDNIIQSFNINYKENESAKKENENNSEYLQDDAKWLTSFVANELSKTNWKPAFISNDITSMNGVWPPTLLISTLFPESDTVPEIGNTKVTELPSEDKTSTSSNDSFESNDERTANIVSNPTEKNEKNPENKCCDDNCTSNYDLSGDEEEGTEELKDRLVKLQASLTDMRKKLAQTRMECEEERKEINMLAERNSTVFLPNITRPFTANLMISASKTINECAQTFSQFNPTYEMPFELENKLRNSREGASAGYKATLDTLERLMNDELSNIKDNIGKLEPLSKIAANWEPDPNAFKSLIYRHDCTVKVISSQRQTDASPVTEGRLLNL